MFVWCICDLEDIVIAYCAMMKDMGINANKVFAEVYLSAVLLQNWKDKAWTLSELVDKLQQWPECRLAVARTAIIDFKASGLDLTLDSTGQLHGICA